MSLYAGLRRKLHLHYAPYHQLSLPGKFLRVLYLSAKRYTADQHNQRAVALTYYTIFAIVPVAALMFGIAKGFALQERLDEVLAKRFANHQEVLTWVSQFADSTLSEARGGLVAGAGVIALFWTVMWLANNVEKSFNLIWNLPNRRNIFRRFSDYLAILLITPILLVVMSSAGVLIRTLIGRLGSTLPWLGKTGLDLFSVSVTLFPLLLACIIFSLIYFLTPNTRVRFTAALLGGLIAGVLYQLLQDGFIYVQSNLYRYNKIYGSFAALPLFLIWLQWSWQIVLFGAEISFVKQNIASGVFDKFQERKFSGRLRREYQLAIAQLLYRNFDAGNGSLTELELLHKLEVPPLLLEQLLNEMVESGALLRIDDDSDLRSYAPGRSPENYTVCDLIGELDSTGIDDPLPGTRHQLEPVRQTLQQLREAADTSPANHRIKEL